MMVIPYDLPGEGHSFPLSGECVSLFWKWLTLRIDVQVSDIMLSVAGVYCDSEEKQTGTAW